MDEEEDADAMAETESARAEGCKRRARASLHRSFSFLHLSRALKKLHAHARRGAHQRANAAAGEPSMPSSAASFLSGCMHHPRTHSFAAGRRDREDALAVNLRSLRVGPAAAAAAAVVASEGGSSSPRDCYASDEEPQGVAPPAAARAGKAAAVGGAGVAVVTFSAAPYEDFRRSMREMVDAATTDHSGGTRAPAPPAVDWGFMEDLLFCYLHLNDRAVHRDILRAFTDTVAALRRRRRAAATSRWTRRQRLRGAGVDSGDDSDDEAVASS